MGSSIAAVIIFFVMALITTVFIFVLTGEYDSIARIANVPIYLYLAGIISAFVIVATTLIIPQTGARKFFILLVSGQIVMAIVVSHFGILESPQDPVSLKKILGAALVIAGALLSTA